MKILMVADFYVPSVGGVEVITKMLAQYYVKKGHEVQVITSRLKNTLPYEENGGIKIYRVGVPVAYGRYLFILFAFLKILEVGRNVDMINTNTYVSALPAWLASKILRKPCIINFYEAYGGLWLQILKTRKHIAFLIMFLERLLAFLNYDRIVNISDYTRQKLMSWGVPEKRISIIHTSVDYSIFKPERANRARVRKKLKLRDKFVFAYYGRPAFTKGIEYFIRAMPDILKEVKNAKFMLMLNRDPLIKYNELMQLIKKLNLEDDVILLDPVSRSELPDYVASMDCVVIPSIGESFSIVAAEACAMGKPVVISRTAALAVSGKYLISEPGDSKSVAEACIKVYKKKYIRSKLRYFLIENTAENYLKLFRNVLKEKN